MSLKLDFHQGEGSPPGTSDSVKMYIATLSLVEEGGVQRRVIGEIWPAAIMTDIGPVPCWEFRPDKSVPTGALGWDVEQFQRKKLGQVKREVAARMFVALVGQRESTTALGPPPTMPAKTA